MFGLAALRRWWHQFWAPAPWQVQLPPLLAAAEALGLPARDVAIAREYLDYNEGGLAFEQIVTQLFEYAMPLTADFYEQLEACADEMELPASAYSILLLLVKPERLG